MIDAFNMAEKYQTPVIVLMDLQLGMNKQTVSDFDFSKVEITDSEGTLVARSPVVGTDMVILKRQNLDDSRARRA